MAICEFPSHCATLFSSFKSNQLDCYDFEPKREASRPKVSLIEG